ncbi:HIT domain-containing protein [Candidatus Parcubacteria bacterium]|nr:HIT domain-containing protein [Patescibacteria group bacterium]MCG2688378.1 HIT domain-containing protein [Candidatus Parcubacteria bacterium]
MIKEFVNLESAKNKEYRRVLKEIVKTDKCPFCKENLKYHRKPEIKRKASWSLTENSWPYKNARYHLIILGNKHKVDFSELTKKDLEEVAYLTRWAIKKYNIKGGALTVRFGEANITGASVSHLHFHLISPQRDSKTKKVKIVNFPIG